MNLRQGSATERATLTIGEVIVHFMVVSSAFLLSLMFMLVFIFGNITVLSFVGSLIGSHGHYWEAFFLIIVVIATAIGLRASLAETSHEDEP